MPAWEANSPVAFQQLSCQISANQRKVEMNVVNKHWKTCAKGNDVITNVISTNHHYICIDFFDTDIQIPETWLQALLPFPTPPPEHLGELAHRLEPELLDVTKTAKTEWKSGNE